MDVLLYGEGLQKRKKKRNAARTAADKFLTVHSFLKSLGIKVVTGRGAPKYVEEMPDVYAQEELDAFFAACDPTRVVDLLGIPQSWAARKRTLCIWNGSDLNFKDSTLRISAKLQYGLSLMPQRSNRKAWNCIPVSPCYPEEVRGSIIAMIYWKVMA